MIQYENGELAIEGVSLQALAQNRPTPFYLYSFNKITENIQKVKDVLSGLPYHISFAGKANNNLYLLEHLKNIGVGIDIVSKGELEAVKVVGFSSDSVIVNGNGKTTELLKELVEFGPRAINIDSNEEMKRLELILEGSQKEIDVALRINPDVDPITHPYISTGLKKNKFGMDLDMASKLIEKYIDHKNIHIKGLHLHIGSQILSVAPYEDAFEKVYEFLQGLKRHNLSFINIGGGWGLDYEKSGKEFSLEEYKERVVPILKRFNLDIILELGRYLIGNAGVLVGKIEYVKKTPYKTFVVTDASMADLIRPSLYHGYHYIYPQYDRGLAKAVDIVGPLCETGDRFAEDRTIKLPLEGDFICICDTGAYGYSMSSNYNFSLRPAEYLLKDGTIEEIRPREEWREITYYYTQDGVS